MPSFRARNPLETARGLAPYVADAGSAAFAAVAAFAFVVLVLEYAMPGSAASVVAPQFLFTLLALTGGAALVGPARPTRAPLAIAMAALGAIVFTVFAYRTAWYYFSSVGEAAGWLAAAIALAVALTCAAGLFGRNTSS